MSIRIHHAVLLAVLWLAVPMLSRAQPQQPTARVYVDEDYDFRVAAPSAWSRVNPAGLSVPGEICRAWSPDEKTTISIFVQKIGRAVHPRDLLEQSAAGLKGIGGTFTDQEVRLVGGMKSMWLIATAPGTGAALTGSGDVPTTQHWVAVPREKDVLVLLLTAPASAFDSAETVFKTMLDTLVVGGVQSSGQKAPEPRRPKDAVGNLDFESGSADNGFPGEWGGGGQAYELNVDTEVAHGGKASGRIKSILASPTDDAFGSLTQGVSAERWRSKRVRLSGWLRTEDVKLGNAGLWMRVDGAGVTLAFDNMWQRGVKGTTGWQRYEVILDVPEEAKEIVFGALLSGDGMLWVDDLSLEESPQGVASTEPGRPAESPVNLDFETGSSGDAVPGGWDRSDLDPPTGGAGYEVTVDTNGVHAGKGSGRIRREAVIENSFGTLTQSVSAAAFRGGRVRISGWLRTQDVGVFSGLWLRIDGRGRQFGFDNMHDRGPKGTTEWHRYEVELAVPQEASAIVFGAVIAGDGTIWVDDLMLESVAAADRR